MSFTCRNMSFTCRNMSFTCRNMSFTCSSSLVFYVVLFWFVCLRPVSCVANVCVCVWIVHSWLPLRYVLSFTIIIQRYQPPYIENQCRLKIITNNILPLTVPSSIKCCFWVMISASSAILLTNWYFDVVVGHFISDHVCPRLVILVISCSVLGRGKKIYIILQVGIN